MEELIFVVPVAIYLGVVFGVLFWTRHRRKTRWPFKIEDRLLRGPGESLRKEIFRIDETMVFDLAAGLVAVLLGLVGAVSLSRFLGASPALSLLAGTLGFLAAALLSTRRILRLWDRRQRFYLGWFGERVVAEKLAPLRFSGWRVFHDVPFVSNGKPFNIDHVVVGEGGLFVIETKTRRKGGAVGPGPDDTVYFDGDALHWPRQKDDRAGLQQAENNATLLTKWLQDEIGEAVPASPIVVIPGWNLEFTRQQGARRACRVDSANWIQNTFKDLPPCLSAKTVDLVNRRLLAKCRDVED